MLKYLSCICTAQETSYLLHSPANAARLKQSIQDVQRGKVRRRKLKKH